MARTTATPRAAGGSIAGLTRPWRMLAVTSAGIWCVVLAFVARICVPRSVDLRIVRSAARVALDGGAPYETTYTAAHLVVGVPPLAFYVIDPLRWVRLDVAAWALAVAGALGLVVGLACAARRTVPWGWPRCWVLASILASTACLAVEPVRTTLLDGQVGLVVLGVVVVDLLCVPAWARGLALGVVAALFVTPLVFVLYLVCARERGAAARALVTFGALTGLLWLVRPGESSAYWRHVIVHPGRLGHVGSALNQSWWGLLGRLPAADAVLRTPLWLALCAVTAVLGVLAVRRSLRGGLVVDAVVATAITGLLVSPVSWTHHWCWVTLLAVALCVARARSAVVSACMWLLLAVAVAAPYGWHVSGAGAVVVDFSLLLAGAALLGAMAASRPRVAAAAPVAAAPAGR